MTTPHRGISDFCPNNSGPPSSFLQQLLGKIKGRASPPVPTVSRRKAAPRSSTPSRTSSRDPSWRKPSVWIGGTSVAQDARARLRAADEARFHKTPIQSTDGTPNCYRPLSRLPPALSIATSSPSFELGSKRRSESDVANLDRETARGRVHSNVAPSHPPHMCGGILSRSGTDTQPLWTSDDEVRAESPLIFIESDSDTSSTASPLEAATSAISVGSTEASTLSDRQPPFRYTSSSISPGKRARFYDDEPEMLSKKMRTVTLPETGSDYMGAARRSMTNEHIHGDDNRRLIRNSEVIERASALPTSISPGTQHALPELSSFSPDASIPRRFIPTTPTRPSTRRASIPNSNPSPIPADTPPYARSLHLIDTDISVYKGVQSDGWRENALCLYCFRRRGTFNKILMHGYEVCGREEILESHYWEDFCD